ncbi:hypothetical protein O7599_05610 [Streptomyces sp. WMMC500]|uniref:DUF6668 family protein n=1 Tax=Streptomyces sp. WMMC500 TaxID=3015154 RepID=UPI00248CB42B|nr:DUF6668 family protein [Streptomyces sp. WMMC500]WBB62017.1 hypothetical protein O7599_05610 [Streptomyces sp. WMMC500]
MGLGIAHPETGATARWWWVGCHGGAGTSTLHAAVGRDTREAGQYWPVPRTAGVRHQVVLVARSHAYGLQAAQRAARQWASGSVPGVELLGLVVIADAPGNLPRPLRDLMRLVSGGVARSWSVPWIEEWRLGEPPAEYLPRELQRVARDLARLTEAGSHHA